MSIYHTTSRTLILLRWFRVIRITAHLSSQRLDQLGVCVLHLLRQLLASEIFIRIDTKSTQVTHLLQGYNSKNSFPENKFKYFELLKFCNINLKCNFNV